MEGAGDNARRSGVRLLLELGRGGMGVVYLALAQGPAGFTKLKVIKRLRPDLASDPRALQMFLDEARLAARLQHPNVVQTNEVGFDGKHYFMEMEYLEGQSYEALVRRAAPRERAGRDDLALSIFILSQTLTGLHYAHELVDLDGTPLRVVHRDVSPHNVMITYDGGVKVLDFGIAKATDSQSETQTGIVKGKVTYMAPEQAARRAVDRRADIFAVGVMLWQALTGARLWGDADDFEIFAKLQRDPIPSPDSVRDDIPAPLVAICNRALARDPDERFTTAAAMQTALEDYLDTAHAGVGTRALARRMTELFAEQRAAVRAEIEEQLRVAPVTRSAIDVPVLQRADSRPSATGDLSQASTVGPPGESGTKVRQAVQIRGLRAITVAAITVALVASAAVAVVVLRGRPRAPAASSAPASIARECETSAQCVRSRGRPAVCRRDDGVCAILETDQCKVLAEPGDVENDRTLWIGAMFPVTGPQAQLVGIPNTRAVDLGRRDFAQIAHGIPSPSLEGTARPLAIVACDDAVAGARAAHHLIDDLRVPAIIGFKSSSEVIDLSTALFIPRRTFVATTNFSALITSIPQPQSEPHLVWRTTVSSAENAIPASLVVSEIVEPRLRRQSIVGDTVPLRVAFVRPRATYALAIADALFAHLRFNGRSALENGDAFRDFVFDDPASTEDTGPSYERVVDALLKFKPHLVIYVGEDELVRTVFAPIESRWPRAERYRPYYVSMTNIEGEEIFRFLGKDAERRRRFFGISVPATTSANAKLTMRYNETFAEKATLNFSPAPPYDALYLVAYAAFVVGDGPITGIGLAAAVSRLIPPGKPIDVGPTRIYEAIDALRHGGNIDLNGAGNPLDYDLTTGESPTDYVIQCVGIGDDGAASDGIESGMRLDAHTRDLKGTLRCP
jgi:hypothetical protein